MILKLGEGIVFVTGFKCSAIYNFKNGKVYSINEYGTNLITNYLSSTSKIIFSEDNFLKKVMNILNIPNINGKIYTVPMNSEISLEFAWLEITQMCNSRCIHCYEGAEHKEVKECLSFDEWEKVICELNSIGCKNIQFIGGEPTIYEKLPELVEFASDIGINKISIFTNLQNINERLFDSIVNNKVDIHFSIYGSCGDTHDKITQINGSFKTMIYNVERLLKKKVSITAHVVIMKENENEKDKIYELLSKIGIKAIRYDEIRKVYGGNQEDHLVKKSNLNMYKPNFFADENWFNRAFYYNTCWYGKCVISTNGDIYPCEFERNILYGNIRKDSLSNILKNETTKKSWQWNFSMVNFCKDCEFRFACRDCRPLAYAENGNMAEKNPRCKYNPYLGLWDA